MKRTISILVIVAMMLAAVLAIIPASAAPEGTAITNAAEFLAMDAAGTYYLANDITLTAPYSAAKFAGTLDGNGKTITLSGIPTAIDEMAGAKVSNLNLVADYTWASSSAGGALSHWANGTFSDITVTVNYVVPEGFDSTHAIGALFTEINGTSTLTNIVTNGTISINNNSTYATYDNARYNGNGGMVGKTYSAGEVEFINCVNNVDVYSTQKAKQSGGFIGAVESKAQLYFENCVNNGDITGTSGQYAGIAGFVGLLGPNDASTTTFVNCRNNGNLTELAPNGGAGKDGYLGGFVGRNYGSPVITAENCVNTGDAVSLGDGWSGTGGFLGNGMTHGMSWTCSTPGVYTFRNCVNLGDMSGAEFGGGIAGAFKQQSIDGCAVIMENCANYGSISAKDCAGGMFGQVGEYGCDIVNLKNCYNAGDVTAPKAASGIVGYIHHGAGTTPKADDYNIQNRSPMVIDGCVNVGAITCDVAKQDEYTANKYTASGILARFGDESNGAVVDITITNCVNAGSVFNATYPTDIAQITPEYKKDDYKCNDSNLCYADYTDGQNKFVKGADAATVDAAVAAAVAVVPGDLTALDAAVAAVADYAAADYTEGWDAFAFAREAAMILTTRAATAADLAQAIADLDNAILGLRSNANVTVEALEAAIADAANYENKEADYTPATFEAFVTALDAAKKALSAAQQSKIDAATEALTAAIAALAAKPDTTELDAAIAKYDGKAEADYVSATWTPFATALAEAKAIKANVNATQADVNGALTTLNAAGEALAAKASTADLEAKVNEINANYNKDNYTAQSYGAVRSALIAADTAIKSGDVSAEDIAAIVADLDAAIAALKQLGNFDELDAMIESVDSLVEAKHTAESWANLQAAIEAIENAKKPASKGNVSVDDIAALKAALEVAIAGLEAYADFTDLNALIATAEALVEADYTTESWAALQAAIADAKTLAAKTDALASEADAALNTLQAAIDSLVEAAAPTEPATEPEESGCGGVIGVSAVVITAVLGLGAVVLKKRD